MTYLRAPRSVKFLIDSNFLRQECIPISFNDSVIMLLD